jgi:DNA polymerase-3 subunit beta
MRSTFEREKFHAAFQLASSVIAQRTPKPILRNVLMEVAPQMTTLTATDLDVGLRVPVAGVDVDVPGRLALPADEMGALLREMSDPSLHLESDGAHLVVRGERSEFRLNLFNVDEFPRLPEFGGEVLFEVAAPLLRQMIHRTAFATEAESSRYALGGVLLEVQGETIVGVGTDGRRMAVMEGTLCAGGTAELPAGSTIVPTRAMQLLERALANVEGNVQLDVRPSELLVQTASGLLVYARLLEGRFPRWRDVLPSRVGSERVELPVGPAHAAVRQAAVLSDRERRSLRFQLAEGKLELEAESDHGRSHVELPVAYSGQPIQVNLDARFVSDFFKVLEPQATCSFEVKDGRSAVTFSTAEGYRYVVMPMAQEP